jgi:AraC family transcriptional activator of pobA
MKEIKLYEGVYGDMDMVYSTRENYIYTELIETRSKLFNWEIEPHIHRKIFQVMYIKTGEVKFHGLDSIINLPIPCILTIPPSVLHGYTYSPDTTGHAFTLSDTFMESLLGDLMAVSIHLDTFQCVSISEETQVLFEETVKLIGKVDEEIFADRPERKGLISAYLSQFFILLSRQLRINEQIDKAKENIGLQHFRAFQKNYKNSENGKSIPQFADELGISPVHLNRVCRAVAGKSASQLVQEFTVQKAQKYLTYTSYSVSEIAYLLKFEDPSYFAKMFKKYSGMSPSEFKKNQI